MRAYKNISPKILLVIVGLFASNSTFAVFYDLPTDGNWYQVQKSETYETVCSSDDVRPCDLLPGKYTLLTFDAVSNNTTRTPIVIDGIGSDPALIVHISKMCTEAIGSDCSASCPAAYLPSGVSCAEPKDDGTQMYSADLVGRFDVRTGYCESSLGILDFSAALTLACVRE